MNLIINNKNYLKIKRLFDICFSFIGLIIAFPVIIFSFFISTITLWEWGFFSQTRVGRNGRDFTLYKIKTMKSNSGLFTNITTSNDPRITKIGRIFRNLKIDEIPQLYNILIGDMSFVGPRPEVPEYAKLLNKENKIILRVRPGVTGPATIKYRNEEQILSKQNNPEDYNLNVIWPDKIKINIIYIQNINFKSDIKYIFKTIFPMIL